MKPDVTVLMTSYNPGKYLLDSLSSLVNQTYKGWELILVDDASTDGSLLLTKNILRNMPAKIIQNPLNLGQSKSLNKGLDLVNTPYLIQLDSDDWLPPRALEVLKEEVVRRPDSTGLLFGNVCLVYECLKSPGKRNKRIIKNHPLYNRYQLLLSKGIICPRFYRTSLLKEMGGWPLDDPFEGRYKEDRILLRLIEKAPFHWINQTLYYYRRHKKNSTGEVEIYNSITQWAVEDALKRWGNIYRPLYYTYPSGRITLSQLIPLP